MKKMGLESPSPCKELSKETRTELLQDSAKPRWCHKGRVRPPKEGRISLGFSLAYSVHFFLLLSLWMRTQNGHNGPFLESASLKKRKRKEERSMPLKTKIWLNLLAHVLIMVQEIAIVSPTPTFWWLKAKQQPFTAGMERSLSQWG